MNAILKLFRDLVGPSAVMAAGAMGGGAVASFLLAGAWFGYELLWIVLLLLPVFVISVDCSSRIGALNPDQGMFTIISSRINPAVAWLILLINVPVHFLVAMGQMSVISSAFTTVIGLPSSGISESTAISLAFNVGLSLALSAAILWVVFSQGYERMQRVMSLLMVAMFLCFLIVALRAFSEWEAIMSGFRPSLPADVPVPGSDSPRIATSSIIAMVGAAIAPGALLGMPYLSANAGANKDQLSQAFKSAIVNLGFIFGAYAMFVLIAGGFALHSLDNHASFDDVSQASAVLRGALPNAVAFLGPLIFSLGLFIAAMTTLVVTAQITVYFMLDMMGLQWRFSKDNKLYHRFIFAFILAAAALAPFWEFPALLKVVLLMGINVVVIPMVYIIMIVLVNHKSVMKEFRAEWWRNFVLVIGLVVSITLAVHKAPLYYSILIG
jgi:manganese transport protein